MKSLNKVTLIGRLGKDPEVQRFDSGAVKAKFTLATSESYTNKDGTRVDQTEWHNIVIWRGLAEVAEKYLRKGKMVYIEGKLRTRTWDDEASNSKRSITEIEVTDLIMLDSPTSAVDSAMKTGNSDAPSTRYSNAPAEPPASDSGDLDDLPF